MAWGTELPILAGSGDFRQEILKGVSHYVLSFGAPTDARKQLVNYVYRFTKNSPLCWIQLEIRVAEATRHICQLPIALVGQSLLESSKPREHGIDQVVRICSFLSNVAPLARLRVYVSSFVLVRLQVNGWLT